MSCKVSKENDATRVLLKGAFRRDVSLELAEVMEKLLNRQTMYIILDLSEIDFLDSSCLGLIIFSSRRIAAYGGQLCIQNPHPSVVELLTDSRLNRVIKILEDKK